MKFAKELDDNAVPEWREKYLDYKAAKKKLKTVERAIRNTDKSPSVVPSTPANASLRDAPVFSFLSRRPPAAEDPAPDNASLRLTRSRSEANAPQLGTDQDALSREPTQPIPISERSPLRSNVDQPPRQEHAMRRYGSIIGTPPEDGDLMRTASRQQKPVSELELPVAALDPNAPKHLQNREPDPEYDRPTSPGSHLEPRKRWPPHPPLSQLSHTGNAYEITKPNDPPKSFLQGPKHRRLFRQNRTASMPGGGGDLPFMRRMFSVSGPSAKPPRFNDVALEAYRELDFRQTEFFHFLDKQLEKVESFYTLKEDEATKRLSLIRDQLHVLRDRRWEQVVAAEQHKRDHDRSRVSHEQLDDQDHPRPNRRFSSKPWLAPVDHAVTHIDTAWDKMRGSYVGKTSKKMEELASPPFPGRINRPPDRQDYVRRPPANDVPYRAAKSKLKIAMAEFYRGLELLKSYALLNRTAFRKINKKFDKTVNAHPTMRYMDKINKSHFVDSDVLDGHLHAVEDLYARYFERGNHKIAVNKLRSKMAKAEDYTGCIWRQGALVAAGSVFGVQGLVYGVTLLFSEAEGTLASYLLQLYAGYFFMILLAALFVLDARIFDRARVNYQFVFEYNRPLNWRQLGEIPAYFYFLLGLIMWLNFNRYGGDAMYIYWPVVLIGISAIVLLVPPPLFYPKTRSWFLYTNWRLLFAGFYPVEFRDFFFGDMFCSLTYSLGNIELFFCLYSQHWSNPPMCNSSHSRLLGFFSALPGIFRALQCLRRYWDTRNVFPHLVNCGKYGFTILYYMSLSLYRIDGAPHFQAMFIVCAAINGIYCSVWDIFMDWSLMDLGSKNFMLRDTLAFKRKWYYYLAIPFDILLRNNWIFYAIFAKDLGHASIVSFCVSLSEVIRRGVWVVFRVENEHCTNVVRSRASRDVPLPYETRDSTEALLETTSNEQEQRRQGVRVDGAAEQTPRPAAVESSRRGTTTSSVDLEHGQTTPASLRRRPTFSADSPVARALRRVGSTMMSAHAQDYERKRKPETGVVGGDSDDDHSSDSDSGGSKTPLTKKGAKKAHAEQGRDRQRVFDSTREEAIEDVDPDEERNRLDTAQAEMAFDLGRPGHT